MSEAQQWQVDGENAGRRLDVFLATMLGASRAEVRRLLEKERVSVDGRAAALRDKGRPVALGEVVALSGFVAAADAAPIPDPETRLDELALGPGWIAVDKPAGMPVHPLAPEERGTVINAVVARHPVLVGVGEGGLRSGVLHRLDVDTSGVLLVATGEESWQRVRRAFRQHRVRKTYHAIVHGRLDGEAALELELTVSQHKPARVRVAEPGDAAFGRRSRPTSLEWKTLGLAASHTLVEVRPRTGFLHQIRASMAHLGHPLVGDTAYGAPPTDGVSRHLLHAAAIAFGEIRAQCDAPEDFRTAWERLRSE